MKKAPKVLLSLTLGTVAAALVATAGSASTSSRRPAAAAAERCVKFAGVEASGNKNSMDPAQQPSSQNSLNINASYNRLTTEDDNWKVLPDLATSWRPNAKGTV
jgi:ABC-type transport system substrate-binding protein